jgi:lysophospholipase L1-like esterase
MRASPLLLRISLAANLLLAAVAGRSLWNRARHPAVERARVDAYRAMRTSVLQSSGLARADLVVLGDSLVEQGPWSEAWPALRVANRGIGFEQVAQIAARAGQATSLSPATVIVEAGRNDLVAGRSVEEVARDYDALLSALRGPRVIVCAVLPARAGPRLAPERIDAVNRELRALADRHGATFVDPGPALRAADGELDPRFTGDGHHLNGPGYRVWVAALDQALR